jgi:hypothetical protein
MYVEISDNKGRYLFDQVSFENNIEWFFHPSIRCSRHLEIIRDKLPKLLDIHPNGVTLLNNYRLMHGLFHIFLVISTRS